MTGYLFSFIFYFIYLEIALHFPQFLEYELMFHLKKQLISVEYGILSTAKELQRVMQQLWPPNTAARKLCLLDKNLKRDRSVPTYSEDFRGSSS